jgi:steroid delta-isomerase-like uncharacterized protein
MSHSLQQVRERIVRAHIAAEERGDWAAALATFSRPRYELTPTEEVHDGASAVMAFYEESARAFPDLAFETRALHATDAGLVHEVVLRGTQRGAWRGLPATGRSVRYAVCNVFLFEEDQLVCERMYFDLLTPLRQLGIARDPTSLGGRLGVALNHPLVLGGAMLRGLWGPS